MITFLKDKCEKWLVPTSYDLITEFSKNEYCKNTESFCLIILLNQTDGWCT